MTKIEEHLRRRLDIAEVTIEKLISTMIDHTPVNRRSGYRDELVVTYNGFIKASMEEDERWSKEQEKRIIT